MTSDPVYVGPRTTELIAVLLLVVGAVAAVGGVGYAVNGATQAPGNVLVPVAVQPSEQPDGVGVGAPVPVDVDGVDLPSGTWLRASDDGLVLVDSTGTGRWTGFLARGDAALGGLAVGLCAVLLAPVLRAVAGGEPFRRGNSARIGWTATIVLLAGIVAPLLPQLAAVIVLDGLGLVGPGSPFVVGMGFELAPVGVAALLFVVAEAFRRGTQIADDTAGLV
ncbi:DUF2975 domain-containing protein [uncultured Cellulomonas sp.]|uniref:DUF2975 domain-containing protein n=1 Tax=uncultured Cellulomonas sp. TaxID=189682 RepID=UPI00261CA813|nr:DUF2975 domain-containing protein [uncultured Cellulomonas sp.]